MKARMAPMLASFVRHTWYSAIIVRTNIAHTCGFRRSRRALGEVSAILRGKVPLG